MGKSPYIKTITQFLLHLIISVASLSFFASDQVYGKALSAQEIIDSVANQLNDINTIKAKITQSISGAGLSEMYKGDYIAANPGKIRVEYDHPYKQLIVSDGDTLWWYIPDSRKVWYLEVNQNKVDVPQACPVDPSKFKFSNTEDFSLHLRKRKWYNLGNRPYVIDLFPESNSYPFSKATLWIDSKRLFLQKYEIYGPTKTPMMSEEHNDVILLSDKFWLPQEIIMQNKTQGGAQKLITRYSNMKVNLDIPEHAFTFTIPEGIDKVPLISTEITQ